MVKQTGERAEPMANDRAAEIICDAERSKARMFSISGTQNDISLMDNDYQMIDAHIDEGLKKKIINFGYIDLSKLLTKGKFKRRMRTALSL